jgi:nucleoside-diphosphate-sugar epimerase
MRVEINCPRLFLNTWVGSALVMDLIAAGRQVLGLARSDKGAGALARCARMAASCRSR